MLPHHTPSSGCGVGGEAADHRGDGDARARTFGRAHLQHWHTGLRLPQAPVGVQVWILSPVPTTSCLPVARPCVHCECDVNIPFSSLRNCSQAGEKIEPCAVLSYVVSADFDPKWSSGDFRIGLYARSQTHRLSCGDTGPLRPCGVRAGALARVGSPCGANPSPRVSGYLDGSLTSLSHAPQWPRNAPIATTAWRASRRASFSCAASCSPPVFPA